jgi:hypothetical protein
VAEWHWEPVTDDLLDRLPPAALAPVRQVAGALTIRESMIFLDGREFTGEPPGLRTVQQGNWPPSGRQSGVAVASPRRLVSARRAVGAVIRPRGSKTAAPARQQLPARRLTWSNR